MQASTKTRFDASLILVFVAVLIVASHDRRWLSRPVNELLPEGIRLDWLSHLKARVIVTFLSSVVLAMRPGRPPVERTKASTLVLDQDLAHVREQLAIKRGSTKKRKVSEWLVEVYGRLRRDHGLGVEAFCKALDVSERTFRSWRARAVRAESTAPAPEPKPRRMPRGEGRFDLDRTLPGIQQMADTTDLNVLGNTLKAVAAQDPGNRHRELWSSYRVGVVETGQVVLDLAKEVVQPGVQFIDDRGTPYMSAETQKGLEDLEAEQAPCKEFTPTEKSTCERSFRTVKEALAPVLAFLDDLTEHLPDLRSPKNAVMLAGLLLDLFHRVYNLGHAHLPHPLDGQDPEVLRCIVQEQREKARSDFRSKLSTLGRIHDQYAMSSSRTAFVRGHRAHALEDIVETEQRMRRAACTGGIAVPHLYFAAILNGVAAEARPRRRSERDLQEKRAREDKENRDHKARRAHLAADPVALLHNGLDLLASQWRGNSFFLGGLVGRSDIATAVERLACMDKLGFEDEVRLECKRWHAGRSAPRPPLNVMGGIVDDAITMVRAAS